MKSGFYEFEITPALGAIIPGAFGVRYAEEIRDRLYVRAGVFANENEAVALAVIDACGITLDVTERIGIWSVYEARLAPISALEPAAGDKIVEGILSLGEELKVR